MACGEDTESMDFIETLQGPRVPAEFRYDSRRLAAREDGDHRLRDLAQCVS